MRLLRCSWGRPMKKNLALWALGTIVLVLDGCGGSYSALGPLLTGSGAYGGCKGSVSVGSVTCPGNGYALLATTGQINISGSSIVIDSYSSANGPYGGINISALGNIKAGGLINNSASIVSIKGSVTPNTPTPLGSVSPTVARQGNLNISGAFENLTFSAGDYYYGTINISGAGVQFSNPSGLVRIWFDQLNISGTNSTIFGTSTSADLWLLGTCGATVNISGAGINLYGIIYTPTGDVNLSGANMMFYGPIVGSNINVSGAFTGIHRDMAICGY